MDGLLAGAAGARRSGRSIERECRGREEMAGAAGAVRKKAWRPRQESRRLQQRQDEKRDSSKQGTTGGQSSFWVRKKNTVSCCAATVGSAESGGALGVLGTRGLRRRRNNLFTARTLLGATE